VPRRTRRRPPEGGAGHQGSPAQGERLVYNARGGRHGPAGGGAGRAVGRGHGDGEADAGAGVFDLLRGAMMVPTFLHTLRQQRLALLGWGAALFVLALLVTNIYTSFVAEAADDVKELIESLPGELKRFAKLGDITSPKGFLDARYFMFMPMLL